TATSIGSRIREASPRGIVIAARGSSDNAALYAKYLFGVRNRALVALAAPSLFTHYSHPPRLEGQCVVGISQSGESPDVIAAVNEAVVGALMRWREVVFVWGCNDSAATEILIKYIVVGDDLGRELSIADFEHCPIANLEAGLSVLIVDGGG